MNRNELRAMMARRGISVADFCRMSGINPSTYHRKMASPENGEPVPEFTQGEISRMSAVLSLTRDEIISIFFEDQVS